MGNAAIMIKWPADFNEFPLNCKPQTVGNLEANAQSPDKPARELSTEVFLSNDPRRLKMQERRHMLVFFLHVCPAKQEC